MSDHAAVCRLAALVAALSLAGCATPIETESWLRVETPHFEVVSGAGAERTVEIARGLELFRAVLETAGVKMNLEPRVPTLVYVFGDSRSFARFQPRSGLAGFMLPRMDRNYLVVDAGRAEDARPVAFHEYVHFVLRNGGNAHFPAWYDEGLAEWLSTVAVEGDRVVVGRAPRAHLSWLVYGNPLSVRQVMTAEDAYEWPDRARERFQAQAWALTHFFYVSDQVGFPRRYPQMMRYLQLLQQGVPPDAACQRAFGTSFEGLEGDFLRYTTALEVPHLGLSLERLEVPERHEIAPLTNAEKRTLLGDLAYALGEAWWDEAQRWYRGAVEARPEDARAVAALGRVESLAGRPEGEARLEKALRLAPEDPEVQRIYAEVRLARAATQRDGAAGAELAGEARDHFQRSIELAPGQVAAYAGLGRAHLVAPTLGDPAEGLAALETAHRRLPADRQIALWLAQLELSQGHVDEARRLLTRMPPRSHGDPAEDAEHSALEAAVRSTRLLVDAPSDARHLERRLDVARPAAGERIRGLSGWVEVSGRGGMWESSLHDVVIVIDESRSTTAPTGTDLDGDGRVGKLFLVYSSDSDDAILQAELQAASVLAAKLDPAITRVGLVTFAGDAVVRAPLGPPSATLDALQDFQVQGDRSRTSIANGLALALEEFVDRRESDARRQRTILLLSDGEPTAPTRRMGRNQALAVADQLGALGVPVHAYALGQSALDGSDFYRGVAQRSGGVFEPVENPADVVSQLADVRFTGLEDVEIRNLRTGESGRAVRIFPDGSFDGYVPLAEGENVLEITARLEGRETLTARRTVLFERPSAPTADDRRVARALRKDLQQRALELELQREARQRRQVRRLDLDLEPDESAATSAR